MDPVLHLPQSGTKNSLLQKEVFWVMLLIALCVGLRAPSLGRPLLGNFAGRSIPYADVARNLAQGNAPWYLPTASILVKGKPTLMMLDLPLISYGAAFMHKASGIPLDSCGRLVSVMASALAMLFLYAIVRRLWDAPTARWAAFFFVLSPLGIIFGQSFQADMLSLCLSLGSLWLFMQGFILSGKNLRFLAFLGSALCFGLAAATRAPAVALALVLLYWGWKQQGLRLLRSALGLLFVLAAMAIPVGWYGYAIWVTRHCDNVVWSVLYQSDSKFFHLHNGLATFAKVLSDTVLDMLLNPLGFGFFVIGLAWCFSKKEMFFGIYLGAMTAILLCMPQKIFDHNYYLLVLVPPMAFFAASGIQAIQSAAAIPKAGWKTTACCALMLMLSAREALAPVMITPEQDMHTIAIAKTIRQRTSPKDKIIFATRSPSLIYYSERQGWNMQIDSPKLPNTLLANAQLHDSPSVVQALEAAFRTQEGIIDYYRRQGATHLAISQVQELRQDQTLKGDLDRRFGPAYESPELILYTLSN